MKRTTISKLRALSKDLTNQPDILLRDWKLFQLLDNLTYTLLKYDKAKRKKKI